MTESDLAGVRIVAAIVAGALGLAILMEWAVDRFRKP